MIRAITFSLVISVGVAATTQAQTFWPPSSPPALPVPIRIIPYGEIEPVVSSEKPKDAQPKPNEGKKEESSSSKPDSSDKPKNPLEEGLNLKPTIQVRGRIEAEAILAAQSAESQATIGDLQNGFGFRRVRLGTQGTIGDSSSWVSEVELAGGNVRLRDVFVGLDALPGVRQVRVGFFREPYSLEGMTSSNFITFLERSPLNVLSPARNWGVCGYWWPDDERVLFTLGAFRDGTPSNGQSLGDDDNWAYTARITGLPIYESNDDDFRLVHLGGAFSQRVPPNGILTVTPRIVSNLLTVEDNPGSPFLPAVDLPTSSYQLYNLQAAAVFGSFSLQGEWMAASVQQSSGGPVFIHGIYVYGSYFLTGEHRGYNRTRGSFDQVKVLRPVIRNREDPRGGFGAIELATRFSYFDFTSENLPPDSNGMAVGTQLYEFTTGVNWYLNSYTRIMFNYTAGLPDKVGFDATSAHTFGLRTALFW